mmetsp:Transcript_6029/g.23919  ORF Transcript_6029/g.23919 Transcript_6029/m.23919 type:complete len:311 (-) Transcript_6029:5629-6561(-)
MICDIKSHTLVAKPAGSCGTASIKAATNSTAKSTCSRKYRKLLRHAFATCVTLKIVSFTSISSSYATSSTYQCEVKFPLTSFRRTGAKFNNSPARTRRATSPSSSPASCLIIEIAFSEGHSGVSADTRARTWSHSLFSRAGKVLRSSLRAFVEAWRIVESRALMATSRTFFTGTCCWSKAPYPFSAGISSLSYESMRLKSSHVNAYECKKASRASFVVISCNCEHSAAIARRQVIASYSRMSPRRGGSLHKSGFKHSEYASDSDRTSVACERYNTSSLSCMIADTRSRMPFAFAHLSRFNAGLGTKIHLA